jgi:hypothetical protein
MVNQQLTSSLNDLVKFLDASELTTNENLVIEKLESFVLSAESELDALMSRFGWNKDSLLLQNETNETRLLQCPYNRGHTKISSKNYEKHVHRCALKERNYTNEDIVSRFFFLL